MSTEPLLHLWDTPRPPYSCSMWNMKRQIAWCAMANLPLHSARYMIAQIAAILMVRAGLVCYNCTATNMKVHMAYAHTGCLLCAAHFGCPVHAMLETHILSVCTFQLLMIKANLSTAVSSVLYESVAVTIEYMAIGSVNRQSIMS